MADAAKSARAALLVGALGVVYGDIGTSPLYAVSEAFFGGARLEASLPNALGVASLILWSLILMVTIKYVTLILRADNQGEGGIFTLLGLLEQRRGGGNRGEATATRNGRFLGLVMFLIPIGATLLYADGVITPAISVLSAIEGLEVITPAAGHAVVPLTLVILTGLFLLQRRGTNRIGWMFGPLMLVWFAVLGLLGLYRIVQAPEILWAINPMHGIRLLAEHFDGVVHILGAVVLAFTGVEALYADMGHFGRTAIQKSWNFIVLPSLALNYIGQGATMMGGNAIFKENIFYSMAPSWALIPLVALSTGATIIASQALISGAFSLTQQAMALGLFPRLRVIHTNPDIQGQIYMPFINWALYVGTCCLVLGFGDARALASAYGLAVTGTMSITTLAFAAVALRVFEWKRWVAFSVLGAFLLLDLSFLGANVVKFLHGGWVPVLIGLALYVVMDTWHWGRGWIRSAYERLMPRLGMSVEELISRRKEIFETGPSVSLVVMASRPVTSTQDLIPPVMAVHYRNWRRLPKHIIFFSIKQVSRPEVPVEERYQVIPFVHDEMGTVVSVLVTFGYMEQPNVRSVLKEMKESRRVKIPQAPQKWLILIGAERFVTPGASMVERIRLSLFSKLNRLSKPVTDYFGLETDSGVTMETINV